VRNPLLATNPLDLRQKVCFTRFCQVYQECEIQAAL